MTERDRGLIGKHLYVDCFAGVAGDMFLGAMLDLGLPPQVLHEGLARLPLQGYELVLGRASHMGIVGADVKVRVAPSPQHHHEHAHSDAHDHEHEHEHQHHTWRGIREMLQRSTLSGPVKHRALDIFTRIASAEGALHGKHPEDVAFHEVGAVDSIVDIVGAALALDYLAPKRVTARRVPLGHGTTRCAHGVLPVPSPAAAQILADVGAIVEDGGVAMELCTPTGAAILASIVEQYEDLPAGRLLAQGFGAGDRQLEDRPNHLRLLLLETDVAARDCETEAEVVEANIDDMPPEWCGHLTQRLFAVGARDVWYTPIVMKKGRPAFTVSALCAPARRQDVAEALLEQSTTIGLRYHSVQRQVLDRQVREVETPYGTIRVKVALDRGRVVNAAPEYEDCKEAADRSNIPLKEVHAAAIVAYRNLADSRTQG